MKPFVVFWNNIPAPYMVERFNLLALQNEFDFEAWFSDRTQHGRSWKVDESEWRFRYRFVDTLTIGKRRFHFPLILLKRSRPDVLVCPYAGFSYLFGWVIAKIRSIKTGFLVEATFDSWVRRTMFKETLKHCLFPKVDFIITVGKDGSNYSQRYGARPRRIFFAPHGIDVGHYNKANIKELKYNSPINKNNSEDTITFIYVGRIVKEKGLDYLLDAFKKVQDHSNLKVRLVIVGDGVDEQFFKKRCKTECIRNVLFPGFYQKNELPVIYATANVFVFPTLGDPYGLVVNEAMASSLPIIATNAAGEINDRIEDGLNGFIVPPRDSQALADAMAKLANDSNMRQSMGSASAKKIAGQTTERWVNDFKKIVFQAMSHS